VYRTLKTNGREVPLIPTLRLRSVSAEGGAGAGVAAPKGSTYTYTSLHVASTAPTTKATPQKTPRRAGGGSSGKKTAATKKKSTRPSTPSPAAIALRATEVATKELPVSMEHRENVVDSATLPKRSVVRRVPQEEKQSGEPRAARQSYDTTEQPQPERIVMTAAPDVQQQRQPLTTVNEKITTAAKVASVREAEAARETEQRRVASTMTAERKAQAEAKAKAGVVDPGSALMQRAAQLLWDDLGMDDAWIDQMLGASSPPGRSRSPSPAPPPTPPPPPPPWMRPAPLIIANSNIDW